MFEQLTPQSGIQRRRIKILLCFFSALSLYLLFTLFRLQIVQYEVYQQKVIEQITVGSSLPAERGIIYDRNGTPLAVNQTVYRVYISPVDIKKAMKYSAVRYDERIADGLASLLSVDRDALYAKTQKSAYLDQTVKRNVDQETANAVLSFAKENGLSRMVHVEAGTKRYYPFSSLASHVIGFTGSDNTGLFGLEAYYDSILRGEDGKYMSAVDSQGVKLPISFSDFKTAKNGNNIVTTLDLYIQRALEKELEEAVLTSDVQNRATGIVMNVKSGEILAMATSPGFDLNNPYLLDASSAKMLQDAGFSENSAEYRTLKNELLYGMWRNKAISELYEPGSTFKILTSAIALETGAVKPSDTFSCPGYHIVGGCRISCHKRKGHGSVTFAQGLMQSCNPVMMQSAERIGKEAFYRYYMAFGYGEKTGIDLPSEALGLFHSLSSLGSTELATSSFGQRFKVSPIAQLSAVCTVANGGLSVTPHLLSYVTDADGTVLSQYESKESERIISASTAKTVSAILEEGVSGDGGSKNAYAEGYHIAAKTGTSEKFDVLDANGNSYLRIGSCVAYAPYDDAEIAVIFIVDEPTSANKYGSVTAAPFVSSLMSTVLPYLGYEKEENDTQVTVPALRDLSVKKAESIAASLGVRVQIYGKGETVVSQTPAPQTLITAERGCIILYTEKEIRETAVPNVIGKSASEASRLLTDAGLNIRFSGANNLKIAENASVTAQSHPPSTAVPIGTVITITLLHTDDSD